MHVISPTLELTHEHIIGTYRNHSRNDILNFPLLVSGVISEHAQRHLRCLSGIPKRLVLITWRLVLGVEKNIELMAEIDIFGLGEELESILAV